MTLFVKVFGERNTGTNLMERVLEDALHARSLTGSPHAWWIKRFGLGDRSMTTFFRLTGHHNLGWKHAVPNMSRIRRRKCLVVAMVKNPYSWLISLHRRPYHNSPAKALSFSDFICTPWPALGCEGSSHPFPTPMALWNAKNIAYLTMCSGLQHAALVRYEDFLSDSTGVLDACARAARIDVPTKEYSLDSLRVVKARDKAKSAADYRDYYLAERWKANLSESDIGVINSGLDVSLAERMGYTIL